MSAESNPFASGCSGCFGATLAPYEGLHSAWIDSFCPFDKVIFALACVFQSFRMYFGAVCFWTTWPCAKSHIAPRPHVGGFLSSVLVADCFLGQILPLLGGLPLFFHLLKNAVRICALTYRLSPLPQIRPFFFFGILCFSHTLTLQDAFPPLQYGLAFKWLRKLLADLVFRCKVFVLLYPA